MTKLRKTHFHSESHYGSLIRLVSLNSAKPNAWFSFLLTIKMRALLVAGILACIGLVVEGKVFSKCGMVKELRKYGIPKNEMANWICLIGSESSFNTKATHKNRDGSKDYGLFQINNHYWCNEGKKPGKACHVTCNALLSNNIKNSVKCARFIKSKQGWTAWYGWQNKCRGKPLPDVSHC